MSDSPSSLDRGSGSQLASATSRSLLSRVKARDPDAWSKLVRLYAPLVHSWCRASGLQPADAADVFQSVFQSVVEHVARFRKEQPGDTFRGWLRRITQNKIRDHFRRREQEPPGPGGSEAQQRFAQVSDGIVPDEEESGAKDDAELAVFHAALAGIRASFEERTWQAFWRTAVDGVSPADVAQELSMSPGAVRVAKSRVLHRLRSELGDVTD